MKTFALLALVCMAIQGTTPVMIILMMKYVL